MRREHVQQPAATEAGSATPSVFFSEGSAFVVQLLRVLQIENICSFISIFRLDHSLLGNQSYIKWNGTCQENGKACSGCIFLVKITEIKKTQYNRFPVLL